MTSKSIRRRLGIGVASACMLASALSSTSRAQITTVDVNNAANWTTGTGAGANSSVTYGFDYGSLGIPQAPGTSNTLAMVLRSNTNGAAAAVQGITVSPNGVSLTGDYVVKALVWMNTSGTWTTGAALVGGLGTSQMMGIGVGYTGGTQWRGGSSATGAPGGGSGIWFVAAGDGGFGGGSNTIRDYSAFTGSGTALANFVTNTTAYFANASGTAPQDNNNLYYQTAFPGPLVNSVNGGAWASAQNQILLSGTITNGIAGVAWREFKIARTGSTVTWSIDSTPIAALSGTGLNNVSPDGGTSITYFDPTSSVAPNALVFGLVASYSVEIVPEPSSIALTFVGIAGGGVLAHRRRRRRQLSSARG